MSKPGTDIRYVELLVSAGYMQHTFVVKDRNFTSAALVMKRGSLSSLQHTALHVQYVTFEHGRIQKG